MRFEQVAAGTHRRLGEVIALCSVAPPTRLGLAFRPLYVRLVALAAFAVFCDGVQIVTLTVIVATRAVPRLFADERRRAVRRVARGTARRHLVMRSKGVPLVA